jgi:hypothetical protein
MRKLARGTAITFATLASATLASFSANAADLSYPPPVFAQPQFGVAAPPAAAPPQVIVIPDAGAYPQYRGVPAPPPPIARYPYGAQGPIPPAPIPPRADIVPPANCPPVWRCGGRGCGWAPGCVAPPQRYSDQYGAPGPHYFDPRAPYPEVYDRPDAPPPPERYPGPYSSEVYPDPADPYFR